MKKILPLLTMLFILLGNKAYAKAISTQTIGIVKPFKNVEIKIESKYNNLLKEIQVYYDSKGISMVDGVKYKRKNKSSIIVQPDAAGWSPSSTYYVFALVKQNANSKNTTRTLIAKFTAGPYEMATIKGTLSLPESETAFEDIYATLEIFSPSEMDITSPYSKLLRITKGSKSVEYSIKVPVNLVGYGLRYSLYKIDDKSYEYIYEMTSEYYKESGYLTNKGMIAGNSIIKSSNLKLFKAKDSMTVNLFLVNNKEVSNIVNKIMKETIRSSMTDYQKEIAIYEYVKKNIEYDYDLLNKMKESENSSGISLEDSEEYAEKTSLYGTLKNRKTVCSGYAKLMKLLLNKLNIECDVAVGKTENGAHAWNVVKIEGKFYQFDVTADATLYRNSILQNTNMYLNINDEIASTNYFNASINGASLPKCDSLDYNYRFHEFWLNNKLKVGNFTRITGKILLPEGFSAPDDGIYINVKAVTGSDTPSETDDLSSQVFIFIPKGVTEANYSLPVIPNSKEYRIIATDVNSMYSFQKLLIDTNLDVHQDLKLDKISFLKGRIKLPEDINSLEMDMNIGITFQYYSDKANLDENSIYMYKKVTLKKGLSEVEYELPILTSDIPYVINYEIINSNEFINFEKQAYYNKSTCTTDCKMSEKLYLNNLKQAPNVVLIKK